MCGKSVPNDEELSWYGFLQVTQENDQVRCLDRFGEQFEIEVPQRQSGDERKVLPVEIVEENGSLPARGPGSATVWPLAQSAFIDENNRAPLRAGFFFSPGQVSFFHFSIAVSSLSMERPTGRCGDQPRLRRIFHT